MPMVLTRYGELEAPGAEDLIGRFLAKYGEWAWLEATFIAGLLGDGARVLDVGAFVGTFGFGVAAQRQLGRLCFVEANPDIVPLLQRNAAAQGGTVVAALVAPPLGPAGDGAPLPIRTTEDLRAALWRTPRWGQEDWATASRTTLQALAGRYLSGEAYGAFLRHLPPGAAPPATGWHQLEAALARAEAAEAALAQITSSDGFRATQP